jgi:hypothetical protein
MKPVGMSCAAELSMDQKGNNEDQLLETISFLLTLISNGLIKRAYGNMKFRSGQKHPKTKPLKVQSTFER